MAKKKSEVKIEKKKTENVATGMTGVIGLEQIQKAQTILDKYKRGKKNLEARIIANEQWYKLHNWEQFDEKSDEQVKPTSAYLFNSIVNKHADAMDNFPSPNILPREAGDKEEAENLSSIIPVILEQNDFEKVYSDLWTYKLTKGTGVYGVYWDKDKLNGLGDISIVRAELLNLFWESGIKDIQDSPNVFYTTLVDVDKLKESYPNLANDIQVGTADVSKYEYDDTVDTDNKCLVVDWYYKKKVDNRTVLHYVKYVGNNVLYASENDTEIKTDSYGETYTVAERGLYDHGKYPFVFDVLFSIEGSPCGFGYIDVGKSTQEQIDRMNQYLLENMLVNTKPRYFVRSDSGINEKEFSDITKDYIHFSGSLDGAVQPITAAGLSGNYISLLANKVDELKETTANRDVSQGGVTGGVTAASGVAAMMEASSKTSRDANKQSYRAYRELIMFVIELMRQFYDVSRTFRITGKYGEQKFVDYDNAYLRGEVEDDFGVITRHQPIFDIEVSAQKQSPYSKMSQNELALQFYGAGFFNPDMADQALACLEMMDFDRKEFVMQRIEQNGNMAQRLQQLEMIAGQMSNEIDMLSGRMPQGIPQPEGQPMPNAVSNTQLESSEPAITRNARQRAAEATSPT